MHTMFFGSHKIYDKFGFQDAYLCICEELLLIYCYELLSSWYIVDQIFNIACLKHQAVIMVVILKIVIY